MERSKTCLVWLIVIAIIFIIVQYNTTWYNEAAARNVVTVQDNVYTAYTNQQNMSYGATAKPQPWTIPGPKTQEDLDVETIIQTAKSISNKPVLVTLINDGYLQLAYNWLCNTKHMGIHKQVLMITTNQSAKDSLMSVSPDINVVVLTVDSYLQKDQDYSHVGYLRLILRRTRILYTLLENDIETFLFECDFLWIRNPIPVFQAFSGKYDIVFVPNAASIAINGGFFYMFPTTATKELFKELYKRMLKLAERIKNMPPGNAVSEGENDQIYLSDLVKRKFAGIKHILLPFKDFPDGKWYSTAESKRKSWHPYIIHNNWITGNKKKVERAKQWGFWFYRDDNTCDFQKVIDVTNTM